MSGIWTMALSILRTQVDKRNVGNGVLSWVFTRVVVNVNERGMLFVFCFTERFFHKNYIKD